MRKAADRLAGAVRIWREHPSSNAVEALCEALDDYDEAARKADAPPVVVQIETGRRCGW